MRNRHFRPRRSLRVEIVQLAAAMALPAAILNIFPYKALAPAAPAAEKASPRRAGCALVTLDQEEERRIMAAAKSAWQVSADGVRRMRLDMFAEEIPEAPPDPVADISLRTRIARSAPSPRFAYAPPTDLGAPEAGTIAPERDEPRPSSPAFPAKELMRLE